MPSQTMKRTQIQGKKYDLPEEEIRIQKLIKKALTLDANIRRQKGKLDAIKKELTEIATSRRDGATTVKLTGVTGDSTITFRESYDCDDKIEEIKQELGSLFSRFFSKKTEFKTTKDLKAFLEGKTDYGIKNYAELKSLIMKYVTLKATKPNVKLSEAG